MDNFIFAIKAENGKSVDSQLFATMLAVIEGLEECEAHIIFANEKTFKTMSPGQPFTTTINKLLQAMKDKPISLIIAGVYEQTNVSPKTPPKFVMDKDNKKIIYLSEMKAWDASSFLNNDTAKTSNNIIYHDFSQGVTKATVEPKEEMFMNIVEIIDMQTGEAVNNAVVATTNYITYKAVDLLNIFQQAKLYNIVFNGELNNPDSDYIIEVENNEQNQD